MDHTAAQTSLDEIERCLTFGAGSECYAVDIRMVREIVDYLPTTVVPRLPPEVLGVTNLRGRILPVFDFASLLGLPRRDNSTGCTIVIDIGPVSVGVVVDRVMGVVQPGEIAKDVPDVDLHVDREFLHGICLFDDVPHIFLHLDKLVSKTGLVASNG